LVFIETFKHLHVINIAIRNVLREHQSWSGNKGSERQVRLVKVLIYV